jgi:hypothetical protein
VRFKRLAESEIEAYLDSGEWRDKAGGYAIQGRAAAFVPAINGSGQGGRLRDPGTGGSFRPGDQRLLQQCGRPAACRNGGTAARAGLPVVKLLVSAQPGELRAAWIDGGRLADLLIQRDDHPSRLGEIHLGRVAAVDRGLGAAFVDLGLESPGFLPLAEAPGERLTEGAAVTVRVLRDATAEKGPRLTARLIDPPPDLAQHVRDAKPPCRLMAGSDLLPRMLTNGATPREILIDHAKTFQLLKERAMAVRPDIARSMQLDHGEEPLFKREFLTAGREGETVEAAIEALLEPRVALPSGGRRFPGNCACGRSPARSSSISWSLRTRVRDSALWRPCVPA